MEEAVYLSLLFARIEPSALAEAQLLLFSPAVEFREANISWVDVGWCKNREVTLVYSNKRHTHNRAEIKGKQVLFRIWSYFRGNKSILKWETCDFYFVQKTNIVLKK